jgi:glyoxylase-like metal-dependent hydrolase (beta-lactamase superfamily II)
MTSELIYQELGQGVFCIDTGYIRTGLAACYLVESRGEAAFIDCGTSHSVPNLLQLLTRQGIDKSQVRYVIPTHVHLDHAGGAGELMRQLPEASLVVHPFGSRHMIDPAKLTAGATAVYGEEKFAELFGPITPVAETRVIEAEDGLKLTLGERQLTCLDTPGHARHHICIHDDLSQGLFTGDTFGLSYREFDNANGPFIYPASTPVQFDPDAWEVTINRLLDLKPESIYLTHYGQVGSPQRLGRSLQAAIADFAAIAERAQSENRQQNIRSAIFSWVMEKLTAHGDTHSPAEVESLLGMDLDLNAQGLEVWLQRREE